MRRSRTWMVFVLAMVLGAGAYANLLQNPGFETDDGSGWATGWSHWNYSSRENYGDAVRSGSYGAYFQGWQTGGGSFWQDASTNLTSSDVVTFSIWANCGTGWDGTTAEIKLQFFDGGGGLLYSVTNDVMSQLTADRGNWNQLTVTYTNSTAGVTTVRPDIYGDWTAQGGSDHSVGFDDADLTVTGVIPEPTVAALFAIGGLMGCAFRKKFRK
jgi:hypothetical protein